MVEVVGSLLPANPTVVAQVAQGWEQQQRKFNIGEILSS